MKNCIHFKALFLLVFAGIVLGCSEAESDSSKIEEQITLSDNMLFVSEEGTDGAKITVSSKKEWTLVPVIVEGVSLDWVSTDVTSGQPGDTEVKISVSRAPDSKPRSAYLKFSVDDKSFVVLNVRQETFEIRGAELVGTVPASDKSLDGIELAVAYSGASRTMERHVSIAVKKGCIELDENEFDLTFPVGAGSVFIPLKGRGISMGDEVIEVTVEGIEEVFSYAFHVEGYHKICNFIENYYPERPASGRPDNVAEIITEDILIKGVVTSSIALEGKLRPCPINEIVIQDSNDPHSALWIKTEGNKNHNILQGSVIEINLKGFTMAYSALGNRYVKNVTGPTNAESIVLLEEPDQENLESCIVSLTQEEFVASAADYEFMFVQVDNVKIKDSEKGKKFFPAGTGGNYGVIQLESTYPFNISSHKNAPWKDTVIEKLNIPHLRGHALNNYDFNTKTYSCAIRPQSWDDFKME